LFACKDTSGHPFCFSQAVGDHLETCLRQRGQQGSEEKHTFSIGKSYPITLTYLLSSLALISKISGSYINVHRFNLCK
jgi:hypothetical protein